MPGVAQLNCDSIEALARLVNGAREIAVLSGAGCSTGSGIPDYRSPDGRWKIRAPITGQDFARDPAARRRYWSRSMIGWPHFGRASPNAAHRALARLEAAGIVGTLITQNVDGLHQRAGSRAVTELHGNLATASCLACGETHPRADIQTWLEAANPGFRSAPAHLGADGDAEPAEHVPDDFRTPDCSACGGILKPDVVFFGDSVPPERLARCLAAVDRAGLLLCVGSSLAVYSGFRFCRHAANRGIPLVAINRGQTRADELLTLKIEDDCAAALEALAAALLPTER
jgi:NAD-dependent SIR2 family protein deacetylase